MPNDAKTERRVCKTNVTKQINKVKQRKAENRKDLLKAEIDELIKKFETFESAHDRYHGELETDEDLDESDKYFSDAQAVYINFLDETKSWFPQEEAPAVKAASVKGNSETKLLNVLSLPKIELDKFDGNPLYYHSFFATFNETVDKVADDDMIKLTRLIQYTTGDAHNAILSCVLMEGSVGYKHAREILRERFGNNHLVTERLINSLKDGKTVRSPEELQLFCDEVCNCNMTLSQMGKLQEVQSQGYILQIVNRLQQYLRNRWKKRALDIKRDKDRYPRFEEFVEFVKEQTLEATDPVYGKPPSSGEKDTSKGKKASSFASSSGNKVERSAFVHTCILCGDAHRLLYCAQFKTMKLADRLKFVNSRKLCENCLLGNHVTANCRKNTVCTVEGCGKRHTRLIHVNNDLKKSSNNELGTNVRLLNANVNVNSDIHMPVVPVRVNGYCDTCALLDTASSNTFCTTDLLNALKVQGTPVTYSLSTLNASEDVQSKVVNLSLTSLDGSEKLELGNVYVVDNIPFKTTCPKPGAYPHLKGLTLVEGGQDVHLLLGQDNAEALLPLDVKQGAKGEPFACRTLFGWSVNGPCRVDGPVNQTVISHFISTNSLEEKVQNLWHMENEGVNDSGTAWSQEDKRVVELWDKECHLVSGHYEIPIPWKPGVEVPNNFIMAMSRLKSLKSSLIKRDLIDRYDVEIRKLLDNGYAEIVPDDEVNSMSNGSQRVWYLPHHGVISDKKPDKLRVVFDCAAKYRGESLNDKCYRGPDLNNKLLNVLVRFRQHSLAIQSDVEAMYYQVKVPPQDQDALRFLWFDADDRLVHCRMTGHVFGGIWCASSSTYALRRTVQDRSDVDPLVSNCVLKSFYVDDCLISVPEVDEAKMIIDGAKNVLQEGGFHLTKFVANNTELQSSVPVPDRAKEAKDLNADVHGKVLGVKWDVMNDQFYFDVNVNVANNVTRRHMLSTVASCYDPLGLVSPLIVGGKMLFQEATRLKVSWDEVVPPDLEKAWNCWISVLQQLSSIHIPRCIKPKPFDDAMVELHHFSDASLRAYGVCSYLRCVNKSGAVSTMLIASKGKLAPIKSVTIPRLELQGAVLAANMDRFLRQELDLVLGPSSFWVDSEIVLRYICNDSRRFNVFVQNRVSDIRGTSEPSQWSHVPGKENPADFITKTQDLNSLNEDRWLHGPKFLGTHKSEWKLRKCDLELHDDDPEIKKEVRVHVSEVKFGGGMNSIETLLQHYSSWYKIKRAVAWMVRFKAFLRGHREFESRLTVKELQAAEVDVLKYVQEVTFAKERDLLLKGKAVNSSSPIRSLTPIIGDDGLIRVGGRLKNAAEYGVCTQPVIIPHTHPIVYSIVNDYHCIAHLGAEWIISVIRQKFWITKVRVVVKSVARKCFTCKKLFGRTAVQIMADLPSARLEPRKTPFAYTGMDCFGPFVVKQGRSEIKRYGCIFTCLSIRAVHVEKLCSLDTDSFICALRRFIARRGVPERIYCDNGTNFVGACSELKRAMKELDKAKIHDECAKKSIEWHFNPPTASHMGGVWERLIRVIRKVFAGVINIGARITDEMLQTILCEVEAIINGRPITKSSDDPHDSCALTPNHLLLLGSSVSATPGVFCGADIYRKRWRCVQHLTDEFWRRWLKEYIPELQKRAKWLNPQREIKVGDLVLIVQECTPRNVWPMGLVTGTKVSDDGHVRSVTVRTKSTTLTRPINKLVLLEGHD